MEVQGPDGSTFYFPDGMDQKKVQDVLKQHYSEKPTTGGAARTAPTSSGQPKADGIAPDPTPSGDQGEGAAEAAAPSSPPRQGKPDNRPNYRYRNKPEPNQAPAPGQSSAAGLPDSMFPLGKGGGAQPPMGAAANSAPPPLQSPMLQGQGGPQFTPAEEAFRQNQNRAAQQFGAFNQQHPYLGALASVGVQGGTAIPGLDRLTAYGRSLFGGNSYEQNLAQQRGFAEGAQKEHPYLSTGAQLAEALALPGAGFKALRPGVVGGMLPGAATGMGYGALYGAANSSDLTKPREVLNDAARGAAVGGALGGVLGGALNPRRPAPANLAAKPATQGPLSAGIQGKPQAPFVEKQISPNVGGNVQEGAAEAQAQTGLQRFLSDNFGLTTGKAGERSKAIGREQMGLAARGDAEQKAALEPFVAGVQKMTPEQRMGVIDYIENMSKGAKPPEGLNPMMTQMAKTIRDFHVREKLDLQDLPEEMRPGFVEDYMRHFWKFPDQPPSGVGSTARGASAAFTKERTVPTYKEGVERGLTPLSDDPIAISLSSMSNSRLWRAKKQYFQSGLESGDVQWASRQSDQELAAKGLARLNGFDQGEKVPVASREWAQMYNNLFDKGLTGDIFHNLRDTKNALNAVKLGWSGYHFFTMGWEGMASHAGTGLQELAAGHPTMAAKSFKEGLVAPAREMPLPFGVGRGWSKGDKLIRKWSGMEKPESALEKEILDLGTRANFHFSPTRKDLMIGASEAGGGYGGRGGSLTTSFKRGTLGKEFKEGVKGVAEEGKKFWANPSVSQAIKSAIGAATKGLAKPWLRATETVMAPIFETYVPRMKSVAFYNKMESFLKQNPGLNDAEKLAAARKLSDSMDNRFGELVRDNLFWKNTINDGLQLGMLSPTWNIGTVREIAGAYPELAAKMRQKGLLNEKGEPIKGLDTKLEYVSGFLLTSFIAGSAYEYMLGGGKGPMQTPFGQTRPTERDWPIFQQMHPETGGYIPPPMGTGGKRIAETAPINEEALLPGYGKDVVSMRHSLSALLNHGDTGPLGKELSSKASPFAKVVMELVTQTDWKNQPTADPQHGVAGLFEGAAKTLVEAVKPISVGTMGQTRPGSNIGDFQRAMGIRPAPTYLNDPAGERQMMQKVRQRAWDQKLATDVRALRRAGQNKAADELERKMKTRTFTVPNKSYGGPQ